MWAIDIGQHAARRGTGDRIRRAGTTRDALYLDFDRDGRHYTLIDTAGVRRRGKVFEAIEKFSVIQTLQAIEDANVVVLCSMRKPRSEQDAHIAGHILDAEGLVVAVNKWDDIGTDERAEIKRELGRKLGFLAFAKMHTISARDGKGIGPLLRSVDGAYAAAMSKLPTPKLTRALADAVALQQPPRAGLVRPKLRYAHQGGMNPPVIVIHGSALGTIPQTYRRFLEHFFVDVFKLQGTPLRIQFKTGANRMRGLPPSASPAVPNRTWSPGQTVAPAGHIAGSGPAVANSRLCEQCSTASAAASKLPTISGATP